MTVEAVAVPEPEVVVRRSRGAGRLRRLVGGLVVWCLYGGMAVGTTWPLILNPTDGLPLGTYEDATIPYTMAWSLWWMARVVMGGLFGYFDAPIFHPMEGAFALSEPIPLLGLLTAPLFSAGATPALAHNVALWLCLALNGVASYSLLRFLRLHWVSAVAGGAMMVMLPAVHQELGTLAFVPLFGVLWTLRAMLRFSREPSWRRGLVVAVFYGMSFLLCMQYALFLALTALPASIALFRLRHLKPRGLAGLGALLFMVALTVLPLAFVHGSTLATAGSAQTSAEAAKGAASFLSWLTVPWRQFVMAAGVQVAAEPGQQALFPGIFKIGLAFIGLMYGLSRRHLRRATVFLALIGGLGVFWSLAAGIFTGEDGLYATLQAVIPGLAFVANPWRIGILGQVACVLLAALGVQRTLKVNLLVSRPGQDTPSPVRGLPIIIIIALVAVVEMFPGFQRIERTPSVEQWQPVGDWIHENIPEGDSVAFVPVPMNEDRAEYEETARWMYLQPALDRPMISGYATRHPRGHDALMSAMRSFPSEQANTALDNHGARWVITTSPVLKARIVKEGPKTGWARMYTNDDLGVVVHERVSR